MNVGPSYLGNIRCFEVHLEDKDCIGQSSSGPAETWFRTSNRRELDSCNKGDLYCIVSHLFVPVHNSEIFH